MRPKRLHREDDIIMRRAPQLSRILTIDKLEQRNLFAVDLSFANGDILLAETSSGTSAIDGHRDDRAVSIQPSAAVRACLGFTAWQGSEKLGSENRGAVDEIFAAMGDSENDLLSLDVTL
jgi:hypothetical protein